MILDKELNMELAQRIVSAVMYDLSDRRGFKHLIGSLDDDIKEELFLTLNKNTFDILEDNEVEGDEFYNKKGEIR